jgi:glycine/D-amino acid oxidase-like deaminating enzyme
MQTDVLVIGDGMVGAGAAIATAEAGPRVTLVDRGYLCTSGVTVTVTVTAGPGHRLIPPDPALRREAIDSQVPRPRGSAIRCEWRAFST